jgi:hypothetical protein
MKRWFVLQCGFLAVASVSSSLALDLAKPAVVRRADSTGVVARFAVLTPGNTILPEDQQAGNSAGIIRVAASGGVYMFGKSGNRSRIRTQELQREAAMRAEAMRRMTNQAQKAETASTNVPAGGPATLPNRAPSNYVPAPPSAMVSPVYPMQQYAVVPAARPAPRKVEKPKIEGPRPTPISEASGPLYNERDPLLGYQREQAEKGNSESQYALGMRYLSGTGVGQDEKLGREWLEKASAQGNLKARSKLRELNNPSNQTE